MSIDSGGITTTIGDELINKNKVEDDELEDGELDSDDDEPVQQQKKEDKKDKSSSQSKSTNNTSSNTSKQTTAKDDKSTGKFQSKQQQNQARKRRRRSESVESDDLDTNKRRKPANRNQKINNRNRRSNASTDDDSDSNDDSSSKHLDPKMMFSMLQQMQEWLINNSDKSNKHKRLEYDKFFERVKNNKSGPKEMWKFFKKNEKMMNQSSQDNLPAMFNQFNPNNMFPPNAGMPNMFPGGGMQGSPQQFPPQMNPNMMPPGNQFGPNGPFNGPHNGPFGPPSFNPTLLPNPMQPQFGPLNDLSARNSPGLGPQSSSGGGGPNSQNKKQKKRKKKDDKDDQDDVPNKQVCKYFLEGHCAKGDNCDFLHQQPYNYKREVCKFYLQDSCGKGDSCTFLHKEFPCKLFHTGQDCTLGENCKFSHEPMSEELREIFINYLDNAELNEELNVAYGLSKNSSKKAPLLGDVPEDVKGSYATWVWQQEMKKLEDAYTGTKRNLFCIDDQFVLKEKPPRDSSYVEKDEDDDEEFANYKDIDERQMSFYFDTQGDVDEDEEEFNQFTKDNDLRKELMNDQQPQSELKSLDEVKKQWLNDESDEEESTENKDENDQKSSIDISKMLDAIRQTTTSTQSNQNSTNNNNGNSTSNNSEFWKTLLNGVNLNDSQNSSKTDQDERSLNQSTSKSTTASNQPRDPRLLRQRNTSTTQKSLSQSTSLQRIFADQPFTWSHGDISFKLYKIDVDKVDYSLYEQAYENDLKLKNDPRLQNYFNNKQQSKSSSKNTSSSSNTSTTNIIDPTDLLAPLTLSKQNEPSSTKSLIIPPAPSQKLSALDLISSSSISKPQTTPASQLSFEEQILASVHLPKEPLTIIPETGLTSLADLVKSKKESC